MARTHTVEILVDIWCLHDRVELRKEAGQRRSLGHPQKRHFVDVIMKTKHQDKFIDIANSS